MRAHWHPSRALLLRRIRRMRRRHPRLPPRPRHRLLRRAVASQISETLYGAYSRARVALFPLSRYRR